MRKHKRHKLRRFIPSPGCKGEVRTMGYTIWHKNINWVPVKKGW